MPKIRKKSSKRGTTHQRARIKHKVSESRKKAKKEVKKDTQWKSKHKKDPGIPNNFPFKEQILTEIAQQRRQAAEERIKRKEDKKGNKALKHPSALTDAGDLPSSSKRANSLLYTSQDFVGGGQSGFENNISISVSSDETLENLKAVLDQADVVLQVLDVRDPQSCRNLTLEEYLSQRGNATKLMFVLNKIDTSFTENVQSWAAYLRRYHKTFMFRSASSFLPYSVIGQNDVEMGASAEDAVGLDSLLNELRLEAESKASKVLNVSIVGIGNAGKSSVMNSILKQKVCAIYDSQHPVQRPSTTSLPLCAERSIDGYTFRLTDTPSLFLQTTASLSESKEIKAHDLLLLNRGRLGRVKDPADILEFILSKANHEDLMVFYNLPAYTRGDSNAFLSSLARSKALLKKGARLDTAAAVRTVLHDWSSGKFARYTEPPLAGAVIETDKADESYLKFLKKRREARREGGVIKMVTDGIDKRQIILDTPWRSLTMESKDFGHGSFVQGDLDTEFVIRGASVDDTVDIPPKKRVKFSTTKISQDERGDRRNTVAGEEYDFSKHF